MATERFLTKDEIEALVTAVFEGRIEPEREIEKIESGGVLKYDLLSTETRKGYVPNLDIIYDGFIRFNRVTMSNRLRRIVEIRKVGANVYKFEDFLRTLPTPVCMAIYKIDPLKGAALISMDSNLVFAIVEGILGGSGSLDAPEGGRMFTSIELRIMQKIVRDALQDMEKAWSPLFATKMSVLRMEMNPRLVNIVPPEYQIITMTLEIQIDEVKGRMVFALPYTTIDPIRDKLKAGMQFDLMAIDPQWSFRLSEELLEAPVDVAVELGGATIRMDDLLNFSPGDTITLDRTSDSELAVKVGGVYKFFGVPGVKHGNKAIMITKSATGEGRIVP